MPENFDLVQQIYTEVKQINERLNTLSLSFVPRPEYEKLHSALQDQVKILIAENAQIKRDREEDKKEFKKQIEEMKTEQIGRQERFWSRLSPIISAFALLLALFEFLSHLRFTP